MAARPHHPNPAGRPLMRYMGPVDLLVIVILILIALYLLIVVLP